MPDLLHDIPAHFYPLLKEITPQQWRLEIPRSFENYSELVAVVENNPAITAVDFSFAKPNDEQCKIIAELLEKTKITWLNLEYNKFSEFSLRTIMNAVAKNTFLTHLNLGSIELDEPELGGYAPEYHQSLYRKIEAVGYALKENKHLQSLVLSHNPFGEIGTQMIIHHLKNHPSLTTLDLMNTSPKLSTLVETVQTIPTLRTLSLAKNRLSSESIQLLANSLRRESGLTTLNLNGSNVNLTYAAAKALAMMVKENTSLRTLALELTGFTLLGVSAMADALTENKTLTTLDLQICCLGDVRVAILLEGLVENKTLTSLDLDANNITDEGASVIAEFLKKNTPLRHLNLGTNKITEKGRLQIAAALQNNENMITLDLHRYDILNDSKLAIRKIEAICQRNETRLTGKPTTDNNHSVYKTLDNSTWVSEMHAFQRHKQVNASSTSAPVPTTLPSINPPQPGARKLRGPGGAI